MPKQPADDTQSRTDAPEVTPVACPVAYPDCGLLSEVLTLRMENHRLLAQTRTDHLTGLFNHRHLLETLDTEAERTTRSGQPTALVMVDLDHFKQVNDTWGHEAGNQALVHASRLIRETMRRIDTCCRYGGEEFAVVVPGTTLSGVISAAERLRRLIEETPLNVAGKPLLLTASIGLAVYSGQQPFVREQFIQTADGFLYEAKRTGRNRVCHPPPSTATTQVTADERAMLFT